ncbi:DUF1499 domain-containing protein [Vibrio profundi]|uniref:DUF1499 domain-containing protein n=1 Tax=Vibrio profundi TaxID=1774960 RepID=UPI0037352154
MKTRLLPLAAIVGLTACSQSPETIVDRSSKACGEKPNCVSTLDDRSDYQLAPYFLKEAVTIDNIEVSALKLPGAKVAVKDTQYIRIECTSQILRFVDDLELRVSDNQLIVRSESRVGYSDFGVNRERADQLRELLIKDGLLTQ